MKATARKLIFTLLAMLATGGALADTGIFTGQRVGPVAELSPEERIWFRQQWNRLPPEERELMRRQLQEKWRDLPPEARQKPREELMERMRGQREEPPPRPRRPGLAPPEDGYGQGYGTRRWEEPGWEDAPRRRR